MVIFSFLDWFWLVIFVVLMIVCGVLFYRLGKRSMADFFLAGRGLPWWLPAASVYATHSATDTPMWISGVIYKYGLRGIWYTFFLPGVRSLLSLQPESFAALWLTHRPNGRLFASLV